MQATEPTISRLAAVLDFETTALVPSAGQIIEGAVALVELSPEGKFGETVETYWSFNDPGAPIPPEISKLTKITDDMVRGKALDWGRFRSMLERASVLVAHNASFDRGWLEHHGEHKTRHWACSLRMIDWSELHEMPCRTLKHLAWEMGFFPNAHRAIDDVETLVQLLRMPTRADASKTYGEELIATAQIPKRLVLALGAPFESKDVLKSNAFRWSPERRVWWKLVREPELPVLQAFLQDQVYRGRGGPQVSEPIDELDPAFRTRYGLGSG